MPTETVTLENGLPLDTAGRPITPSRLRRAMTLNIFVGAMGMAWFVVCSPQQILNVFFKNELGASASQLGWMVALIQLACVCHLSAIFIYSRMPTRKGIWVWSQTLHRLFGFVLAGVAVYAARGGDRGLGVKIITGAMAVSWLLATSTASGWWAWMADLVPERIRATFFGRRATVIRALNMAWFFGVTFALDHVKIINIFYVYAAIFALGGLFGVLDILIHSTIPEPRRQAEVPRLGWREFTEPLRNRNFLAFSLAIGAWNFANCVLGPFVAPYITASTADGGLGGAMTWLGISGVVTQSTMILTGTAWGVIMDRFGRKPVVLLGSLHPIAVWIGCFFMTAGNFPYILVVTALISGLLGPAFWDGSGQLMLTLTPQRNRNAYVSWHLAMGGVIAAGGSLLGGWLSDSLRDFHYELWQGFVLGSFHMVALASLALSIVSQLMLHRIREGSEKPVGYVVSRLFTPGIIRTFMNIGTITSAASPTGTVRALRAINGASSHLAVVDILGRLDDPAPEVREEAARTLGRIGAVDAVEPLIRRLRDPNSTIRPEAAAALGQIGDRRAVPALEEGLASPLPEIKTACARALEAIQRPRDSSGTTQALRAVEDPSDGLTVSDIVRRLDDPDPEVRDEAARALGRVGSPEAVDALVSRLRDPGSTIRSEAAWALGQIGDPRAVTALIEGLSSPSGEVQDACARALGHIGGRESVYHLRRLLDGKHADRVVASGAEAVSKHGILEAAWEIFPRMHGTTNPVLRSQLAIAMGNLLGRPGEFYKILTVETVRQGSRLGRLFAKARRTVRGLKPLLAAQRPAQRQSADALRRMEADLEQARTYMEAQAYRAAIEALYKVTRELVRVVIARDCPDDEVAFDYAFTRDVRLGLGFWFVWEANRQVPKLNDQDLLHTDALLALYFLSTYRLPPEKPRG